LQIATEKRGTLGEGERTRAKERLRKELCVFKLSLV
jgi:hypothetical protein